MAYIIEHLALIMGSRRIVPSHTRTDLLSKLASTKRSGIYKTVIQETLTKPSIQLREAMVNEEADREWMTIIWNYLEKGAMV